LDDYALIGEVAHIATEWFLYGVPHCRAAAAALVRRKDKVRLQVLGSSR